VFGLIFVCFTLITTFSYKYDHSFFIIPVLLIVFQAFSLPVIQIVHETVRDALSGHKSSRPAASAAAAPAGAKFT